MYYMLRIVLYLLSGLKSRTSGNTDKWNKHVVTGTSFIRPYYNLRIYTFMKTV